MPLTPTENAPVVEGLAVRWIMSNGNKHQVCWVRSAALEKLEANPDLERSAFLDAFNKHRALLEATASDIFEKGKLDGPNVIVRKENV